MGWVGTIGDTVLEQLGRMDFTLAEEYLAEVRSILDPLQRHIETARDRISLLTADAATAPDAAALHRINTRAVDAATDIFLCLHSAPMVQEVCTVVRDAIAERALELARRDCYFSGSSSGLSLALVAVGSDGRREQSLFTDQDYLFVLGSDSGNDSQSNEEIDRYFGMLGSVFMTKLEEAGISRCSGGIMPVNDDWRGTQQQWRERLTTMLRFERSDWEKNILSLIALMDARFVRGDPELGHGFGGMVRSLVRNTPDALRHMARVVGAMKLSKGFLNRFTVEAAGPHKGEFNLKTLAWMPLVMSVRLLAVDHGIEETSTLARLEHLRSAGHLTDRMAAELTEAYHLLTGQRIRRQLQRIKNIIDDDNYINPYKLPTHERESLKKQSARWMNCKP